MLLNDAKHDSRTLGNKNEIAKYLSFWEKHCNPVQGQYRARTGFSLWSFPHREKPVCITGNPCFHCRDPCFHYREFPVRKQGMGLQCIRTKWDRGLKNIFWGHHKLVLLGKQFLFFVISIKSRYPGASWWGLERVYLIRSQRFVSSIRNMEVLLSHTSFNFEPIFFNQTFFYWRDTTFLCKCYNIIKRDFFCSWKREKDSL